MLIVVLGGLVGRAQAEVVRFRFYPADTCGHTSLRVGPKGQTGEWQAWGGAVRRGAYYCPLKATHIVTFKHPHTCALVKVPMKLCEGTPRIDYRPAAVVYSYGTYTITVNFFRDGSVETVYNSGLFRPLE